MVDFYLGKFEILMTSECILKISVSVFILFDKGASVITHYIMFTLRIQYAIKQNALGISTRNMSPRLRHKQAKHPRS